MTVGHGSRVTLQTIADALGVSRTTVSNAFSRPDQLNPGLRARILALADELGYPGPNPAARTLRRGQAGALGLLFTEALDYAFTDPAAVQFLRGVALAATAARSGLLLAPSGVDTTAVRDAVVDGFLIYSMPDDSPAVEVALGRRLPALIIDEPYRPGVPFVGIDDRAGGRLAVQHLLEVGHQHVAGVTANLVDDGYDGPVTRERLASATFHVFRQRLRGYADGLGEAGVDFGTVPIQERAANAPAAGADAAAVLLDAVPRPTAILATTDQLALGVLAAARDRGIAVPGALSVVGFDDVPDAATARPGLTTVRQPLLDKGRIATELLLQRAGDVPASTILPVELVVRASTGTAR